MGVSVGGLVPRKEFQDEEAGRDMLEELRRAAWVIKIMPVDENFIRCDNYVSSEPLHVVRAANKLVDNRLMEAVFKVANGRREEHAVLKNQPSE